ncbi:hypothetical protein ACI2IX_04650 [Leifsonia aquatica]|uniref:hypothetical protein n=1 Tax=Leifsonia aquatica TaxID=144185 RepID=UPI00384D3476
MAGKHPLTRADRWVATGIFVGTCAVFGLGLGGLGYGMFHRGAHSLLAATIGGAAGGLVFGFGMTFAIIASWRADGGRSTAVAVIRAVRADALPADADPAAWLPVLARRLEEARRWKLFNPLLFATIALLGIGTALTVRDAVYTAVMVGLVAVIIGIIIGGVATRRRREQSILALIEELEARRGLDDGARSVPRNRDEGEDGTDGRAARTR